MHRVFLHWHFFLPRPWSKLAPYPDKPSWPGPTSPSGGGEGGFEIVTGQGLIHEQQFCRSGVGGCGHPVYCWTLAFLLLSPLRCPRHPVPCFFLDYAARRRRITPRGGGLVEARISPPPHGHRGITGPYSDRLKCSWSSICFISATQQERCRMPAGGGGGITPHNVTRNSFVLQSSGIQTRLLVSVACLSCRLADSSPPPMSLGTNPGHPQGDGGGG